MMKKLLSIKISLFLLLLLIVGNACNKYLEEPSNKALVVPSTLADLQALIDRPDKSVLGFTTGAEESTDDYYLSKEDYEALDTEEERRRYRWNATDIWAESGDDWYTAYFAIYGSNSVLDFLPGIPESATAEGRYIKGQALLWRAFHYHDAAQLFTLPYDAATANTDLGLPLRLNPDFNEKSVRSTVADTYAQIIADLKEAIPLLITNTANGYRGSRQGAYGVLARVYLTMRDYEKAGLYADSCLNIYNTLLDLNELDQHAKFPFSSLNKEVILQASSYGWLFLSSRAKMQQALYDLYDADDLRKKCYYTFNTDGSIGFKGQYIGYDGIFTGITSAEMYLIRAEAYARKGETVKAMEDLNTLLVKRWDKTKTFLPYNASSANEALSLVLTERRKELVGRGLRWQDIRRLNKEGANIIQQRRIGEVDYFLPPNDLRYALAIPETVIDISGMPQNPR